MRLEELENASSTDILELFTADMSREKLADKFVQLGLPSKKREEYRYADIESLLGDEFALVQPQLGDIEPSKQLIITDGIVTHAPPHIEVSYTNNIVVDGDHFDPMYYLGHIASKLVLSISIKQDTTLEILHKFSKSNSLLPYRIALYLDDNVHASILESFEAVGASDSLVLYGYDAFVSRDASLTIVKNQTIDNGSYRMIASHKFNASTQATINLNTFDFGSASSLQTILVELGEYAHVEASHLLYASSKAKRGTVSKIIHKGEHSTSNHEAKNILADSARGIFDALIKVENSAKYTKAHQKSKAILLESGAYMASRPQLEIYIDELEASHGSTTGQLDGKQLFYLRSRGITEIEARKMLIQAFANEMIDEIKDESVRERIHRDFETAYYGEVNFECIETCHGCEDKIIKEGV